MSRERVHPPLATGLARPEQFLQRVEKQAN